MPEQFANVIRDWWGFLLAVGTGLVAYIVASTRQQDRIDQIAKAVAAQGVRITALEAQGHVEAVHLAKISTSQGHILAMLAEIKATLAQKADK